MHDIMAKGQIGKRAQHIAIEIVQRSGQIASHQWSTRMHVWLGLSQVLVSGGYMHGSRWPELCGRYD